MPRQKPTFLKNFGKFHVASLNQDEIPADKVIVEMFSELQSELARLRRSLPSAIDRRTAAGDKSETGIMRVIAELTKYLKENPKAKASSLINNVDFVDEMESKCDAPRYFSGPTEFRNTLERAINFIAPAA